MTDEKELRKLINGEFMWWMTMYMDYRMHGEARKEVDRVTDAIITLLKEKGLLNP